MRVALLVLLIAVSACSMVRNDSKRKPLTLGDLSPAVLPPDSPSITKASLEDIEHTYLQALAIAQEPELVERIRVRLADIEMSRSEKQQFAASDENTYFDKAIKNYTGLVGSDNQLIEGDTEERLLYRLSKAYALDGRMKESSDALGQLITKYPESRYRAEAEFRQAENAFSQLDYGRAELHYTNVEAFGQETPFYLNAIYMKGWSQFKRNHYRASVVSFTSVLDALLGNSRLLDNLQSSQKNLADDVLRVMGFAFSYMDGVNSIDESYKSLGARHYQHLIYQQLASLYLEKKRYRDAAQTLQKFIRSNPSSQYGPEFTVQMINVYNRGNFPSLILPAKENYIQLYGARNVYWQQRSAEDRKPYAMTLKQYLDEVSSYYHSRAQSNHKESLVKKAKAGAQESIRADFIKAADYYAQFVEAFPQDIERAKMRFLMAEALNDSGQLEEAVISYEQVAYTYPESSYTVESAYAAIILPKILADQYLALARQSDVVFWQQKEIENSVKFADHFAEDKRAIPVLVHAAQMEFEQSRFQAANELALRVTQWQPKAGLEHLRTAWLVAAHSYFDLNQYDAATNAYRQALVAMSPDDLQRDATVERLAASLFKSAELKVAKGEKKAAAEQLLSIRSIASNSKITANAQYDAGNYFMELEHWSRAESIFLEFRRDYPQHELTDTVLPKLVVIYQSLKNWPKAADALNQLANQAKTPEERRKAKYLAAELYQQSKLYQKAIVLFSQYLKDYPVPFDTAVEARAQLVELTLQTGDKKVRDSWLRELIKSNSKAGNKRTDRSRHLAAMAAAEFADRDFEAFKKIKLTQPFKKSIKVKLRALNLTVKAYQGVLDYKIAEYTTLANHRLGALSAQLYNDLVKSERPSNLSEMALEEYDIMLEEQAYPHKKKAVSVLEANTERAWVGIYDQWVKASFLYLAKLLPARYGKQEVAKEVSYGLH